MSRSFLKPCFAKTSDRFIAISDLIGSMTPIANYPTVNSEIQNAAEVIDALSSGLC